MAELSNTGLTFAYRGNTFSAYYADGAGTGKGIGAQSSTVQILSATGAFASSGVALGCKNLVFPQELSFSSRENYPQGTITSYLFRFIRPVSGVPAGDWFLMKAKAEETYNLARFEVLLQNTGIFRVRMWDWFGTSRLSFVALVMSTTADLPYEAMVTMNWSSRTCRVSLRDDTSVLFDTSSSFGGGPYDLDNQMKTVNHFGLNRVADNGGTIDYLVESLFWNTEQAHDYTLRTDYWSTTSKDVTNNTSPGVAKVESGTSWILDGNTLTGTLAVLTSVDPGVGNVLSGTGYTIDNVSLTGSYHDGSYSDPGISNVKSDTNYIFNDSTLTGTLNVPIASSGPAGTLDLNNIKETTRFILSEANTTTASPVDLSSGLATNNRVKLIAKLNPNKIKSLMNRQNLPLVTMWLDDKDKITESIAKNQVSNKRTAEISLNIMGMIQNINYSDKKTDPADDDIEKLMENIELTLRAFTNLNNSVLYQIPESIEYHSLPLENKNHIRVGLLSLRCKVQY